MTLRHGIRSIGRLIAPLSLSLLSACAAIKAQGTAGEGYRALNKDEVEVASTKFQESLAISDNDTAHAGLADVYLRQGKYAEAEQEAKAALELAKANSERTSRYTLLLARTQLLQGQGQKAYEAASDVVSSNSDNMADPISKGIVKQGLLLKARILQATGTPADTIKFLDDPNIQMRWPDDLDFRSARAIAIALSGKHEEALALAQAVLRMNEKHYDAQLARGIVLAEKGDAAGAKAILEAPLREDHSRVMVFQGVTRQLRGQGKLQESLDLLNLLASVQPKNSAVHGELAIVLMELNKNAESIQEHGITLQTNPALAPYAEQPTAADFARMWQEKPLINEYDRKNLIGYYGNLGELYRRTEAVDKMLDAYERSASIDPSLVAFQILAQGYTKKGDTPMAVKSLERALAVEPDNGDVLKALGTLAYTSNQPEKAMEYFKRAAQGKGDDVDTHQALGIVLYNTKMYAEAVKEFDRAVKLRPDNVELLYYLAISQKNAGDKKGADATLRRVVALKVDHSDAYRELGNLALERKAYKEAEKFYNLEDKYKGKKTK